MCFAGAQLRLDNRALVMEDYQRQFSVCPSVKSYEGLCQIGMQLQNAVNQVLLALAFPVKMNDIVDFPKVKIGKMTTVNFVGLQASLGKALNLRGLFASHRAWADSKFPVIAPVRFAPSRARSGVRQKFTQI